LYPVFVAADGSNQTPKVTTSKLSWDASSGQLNSEKIVATSTVTGSEVVASNGIILNNMTISANVTIPSGYSASSVGPVTVAGGVSVTVPSGSRWLIL
jgi:hypothetical protein